AGLHGLWSGMPDMVLGGSTTRKPLVQKILPKPSPGLPLVAARDDVDTRGIQRRRHQSMAVGEPIVLSESQMQLERPVVVFLDETPDAALVIIIRYLPRSPIADPVRPLDLTGHDVIAQIGGEQTQPIDFPRVALRISDGHVSSERNTA